MARSSLAMLPLGTFCALDVQIIADAPAHTVRGNSTSLRSRTAASSSARDVAGNGTRGSCSCAALRCWDARGRRLEAAHS